MTPANEKKGMEHLENERLKTSIQFINISNPEEYEK